MPNGMLLFKGRMLLQPPQTLCMTVLLCKSPGIQGAAAADSALVELAPDISDNHVHHLQ